MLNSLKKIGSKEDFFSLFLNSNWSISKEFINNKNWIAVPVPNNLTLIESEWMSNAIHSLHVNKYLEYTFEFNGDISIKIIENNQNNIFYSDFNNSDKYVILTNDNLDFLYFKNQNNLYHLFCGEYDFIYQCLKCSHKTAENIFFYYGVNDYDENTDEYLYLKDIWEYYSKP